ncbi:hypothetical protein MED92_07286 [Oceanospirillum sp. MED92]|uniref:Uncharacterized protein n=2 Tax=Neptuniibacter caesariensis TaxID=207954 RepID=A0A7U8C7C6_NEPCE|nr:hypothetical protein MED92_07286 [Oceanospirillum sp. MED92] [Neptuniibacter caesariensis]
MTQSLLNSLLKRGDKISIHQGILQIDPASGKPVPDTWLMKHQGELVSEICKSCGTHSFKFYKYSTGNYCKAGGVTLHFIDLLTGSDAYCIYNVALTRKHASKHGSKGSSLPKGKFRAGSRSDFVKFWIRSGLQLPKDNSSFHDRMGKLKKIIFTAEYDRNERIIKQSLAPLSIEYEHLTDMLLPLNTTEKSRGKLREISGNLQGKVSGNDYPDSLISQGIQKNSSTGQRNYGNKVNSKEGIQGITIQPIEDKLPSEQTVDEWLQDYTKSA